MSGSAFPFAQHGYTPAALLLSLIVEVGPVFNVVIVDRDSLTDFEMFYCLGRPFDMTVHLVFFDRVDNNPFVLFIWAL